MDLDSNVSDWRPNTTATALGKIEEELGMIMKI